MLEEYKRLHALLLEQLLEYHNAHVDFVNSRLGREKNERLRRVLKSIRITSKSLHSELLAVNKRKQELYKDHYQTLRKNKNGNNKSDQNTI
jgi:hypothetical protein